MVRPGIAMYGYIQRFAWASGGRGPGYPIDLSTGSQLEDERHLDS